MPLQRTRHVQLPSPDWRVSRLSTQHGGGKLRSLCHWLLWWCDSWWVFGNEGLSSLYIVLDSLWSFVLDWDWTHASQTTFSVNVFFWAEFYAKCTQHWLETTPILAVCSKKKFVPRVFSSASYPWLPICKPQDFGNIALLALRTILSLFSGTPNDCRRCQCPGGSSGNQFSVTCRLLGVGSYICDACEVSKA